MATNLRRIRHDRGLTQEELADRSGISPRYIGSVERARVSATVTVLGQIAAGLGIDPAELISQTADAPTPGTSSGKAGSTS